ncbi:MAG TPA: hypothetical protein VMH49_05940 [Thermoplasmata archaeon]|nr:hypothetical protein [Thermoplasmata archaeon]
MRGSRIGAWLSLVRQGLAVEVGFGTHSLETLVAIAESVEQGVYRPGSLASSDRGIVVTLANPPLRVGAFGGVRAWVDGSAVAPERLRVRAGAGGVWKAASTLSEADPLVLAPGRPTELALDGIDRAPRRRVRVRLEFDSVAIPPLVWLEFDDELPEPSA